MNNSPSAMVCASANRNGQIVRRVETRRYKMDRAYSTTSCFFTLKVPVERLIYFVAADLSPLLQNKYALGL